MRRLFDEKDNWTTEATELTREVYALLMPVIKRKLDEGVSIRDIAYVIGNEVTSMCAEVQIRARIAKRKEEGQ